MDPVWCLISADKICRYIRESDTTIKETIRFATVFWLMWWIVSRYNYIIAYNIIQLVLALFGAWIVLAIRLTWARGRGTTSFGKAFFWLAVLSVHWALCTEEGSFSKLATTACSSQEDDPAIDSDQAAMKTPCWLFERGLHFVVQGIYTIRVPVNYLVWWNVERVLNTSHMWKANRSWV